MSNVTVRNAMRVTLTYLAGNKRVQIAPGQYGELPETVAAKYIAKQQAVLADTDKAPIKPTPKRTPKKPDPEDVI